MDEKQLQILSTAARLFDEKGIQQTSVSDIAKECKMSKATFYKYFKSKETIIGDIILLNEQKFLDSVGLLNQEKDLNGKEKLIKKIRLFWDYSFSRGTFSAFILENVSQMEKQEIWNSLNSGRSVIIEEYKTSLRDAFGLEVERIMGDLILCMEGMIREFLYLPYIQSRKIEADVVTRYIFTMLDAIVEARGNEEGIIDESFLYDSDQPTQHPYRDNFKQTLIHVKEKIDKLSIDREKREKLLEATQLIEKEFTTKQYQSLLMDALLALLGKEPELLNLVAELEQHRKENERVL